VCGLIYPNTAFLGKILKEDTHEELFKKIQRIYRDKRRTTQWGAFYIDA